MPKPSVLAALLLGVFVMTIKILFLMRKNHPRHESDS